MNKMKRKALAKSIKKSMMINTQVLTYNNEKRKCKTIEEYEKKAIIKAIQKTNTYKEAAKELQISVRSIYRKIKKYNLNNRR